MIQPAAATEMSRSEVTLGRIAATGAIAKLAVKLPRQTVASLMATVGGRAFRLGVRDMPPALLAGAVANPGLTSGTPDSVPPVLVGAQSSARLYSAFRAQR